MKTDTTDLIVNPESYWKRRAEKAEARVKELEGAIYHVLHSGQWYASALEIDLYENEGMDGNALEAMMQDVLGFNEEQGQ